MSSILSIILTSYNRPALLKKSIESVFAQSSPNFQLIIADDNSNKPQVDELIAEAAKDPRVIVWKSDVRDEDRPKLVRPSVIINESYKYVTGNLLAYLCDDCWLMSNCVKIVCNFFDAHSEANGAYCIQELRWVDLLTGQEFPDKGVAYRGEYNRPLAKAFCAVDHSQVFHRKWLIDKGLRWNTDPFNYKAPDGLFFDSVCELGGLLYPINQVLSGYYYHSHNMCRSDPTKVETFRW